MPIYEYRCRSCGTPFEKFVKASDSPSCPSCNGEDLERLSSLFAVDSEGTRKSNFNAGKKGAAREQRDKTIAEYEDYKHHHE